MCTFFGSNEYERIQTNNKICTEVNEQSKNEYIFVVYRVRVWGYINMCVRVISRQTAFTNCWHSGIFSEECARIHGIAYTMCVCVCMCVPLYLCSGIFGYGTEMAATYCIV